MTDDCYAYGKRAPLILLFLATLFVFARATLSPDDAQKWRAQNANFDWQQTDGSQVRIVGRGAVDMAGNLYFAGSKAYANAQGDFIDDENMFIARINAEDTIGWTKEIGTNETDGANFVAVMNETVAGVMTQYLYVVGWTWGFMDEAAHALNSFGRFGGRDVVLLKLRLEDGRKIWTRQFGSTADDVGYGVQRDGGFDRILLTGSTATDQADAVIEFDVSVQYEPRQKPFTRYKAQLMDPRARQNPHTLTQYQFAASVKRNGDIVDFAMDGGVTLSSRRVRIAENSSLVGEYAVVLNRQPLEDVIVTATIVCLTDPSNSTARVQQVEFLASSNITRNLLFSRTNWNREQLVRVVAVDDWTAEGVHYAVITHDTSSKDPAYNGDNTPFLYGRNITFQIDDNDVSGIQLSRRHVFVAEGGLNDSYSVVLRSRPWFPVNVSIVPLHASQAFATPDVLSFEPGNWNISQIVSVSAVDDNASENEFGGLHFGGRLLHYSHSKDRRYLTRRPRCYDVPRCSHENASLCLTGEIKTETMRICDLSVPTCYSRLGNGACIAQFEGEQMPLQRFGSGDVLNFVPEANMSELTYASLQELIADQLLDIERISAMANMSSMFPFRQPPPRLRGFILSFLGLLNVQQARQMHKDFLRTLQAICSGLDRLSTHHWLTQLWPEDSFRRVLKATLAMFGGSVSERHLWGCGMASFRPGSSGVNISIWDNDPGVTLSKSQLQVYETGFERLSVAQYSIVLNAPPTVGEPSLQSAFCSEKNFDSCGLWSNFSALASLIYKPATQKPLPNVTVLIVGNPQVSVSPSYVTFTSANWFVPQWITVRAVNDDLAEEGIANVTINHRVQSTLFGYGDNGTAFWFQGASPTMDKLFPQWCNASEAQSVPYNYIPRVVHSPQHRLINVQVRDNDVAGVIVAPTQPLGHIRTREADDVDDNWVGDLVKSYAFSEISLTKLPSASSSLGFGAALRNVLVFERDAVTFMKFHVPQRHEGDTYPGFAFARLRVFETPFKVINSSGSSSSESSSSTAFETEYKFRVTVVDNAWTTISVGNGSVNPMPVKFLGGNHSIEVTALLTKQRFVSIDVTPLMTLVLPTRLPVVSLRILVLESTSAGDTGEAKVSVATQLCSSLFERALRPTLSWGYRFPNRLLNVPTRQSSSLAPSSLAVDGTRDLASSTLEEDGAWWEATFPDLTRIGSLAIFVPPEMNSGDVAQSPTVLIVVAARIDFAEKAMNASEAKSVGCPDACPTVLQLPLRKSLVISQLNAGVRTLRIYRQGYGALQLTQVEAYDSHLAITPAANGIGLRSRLKMDWNGRLRSNSWRLLQSVRQSDDENLALGMRTQQSSTAPPQAVSSLAVDGQQASYWDPLLRLEGSVDAADIPASTRTIVEKDPWWEVDLGSVVPIASVELFPFVGERGRGFCGEASDESSTVPMWAGDLVHYHKTDMLLRLEEPFQQSFLVALSDTSLDSGGNASVLKTLEFSCAGGTKSVSWSDVFAKARFVRVQRPGENVTLMLNEVVIKRWNPATTPELLLVDLRGSGDTPIALSSIQLFPPLEDGSETSFGLPVAFSVHSVSSERAPSGAGSAISLLSVSSSDCYIAAAASFREWIVLRLDQPSRIGHIEISSDIAACGGNVSPVTAFSVSARGIALDGLRSPSVQALVNAAPSPTECSLTALATLLNPSMASSCSSFTCSDGSCRGELRATDSVMFSDFNDVILFGVPSLVPTIRLPLSQHDVRAMLLRDNPVALWGFETEQPTMVSTTRMVNSFNLTSFSSSKTLRIDDDLEQTFFSNAVAVQPTMSAFSIELWVRLRAALPKSGSLVTLASSSEAVLADIKWAQSSPRGVFTVYSPSSGLSCSVKLPANSSAFDTIGRWYHVTASYEPSNAGISLSIRHQTASFSQEMEEIAATAVCNMPLLSTKDKAIHLGAFSFGTGFLGDVAAVAWYVDALTERQWLDHFHDFLVRGSGGPTHNSYALRLNSKPSTVVTIEMDAELACYYFSLCNVTVIPRTLLFVPENWNISQHVRVIATDDQLYEGLHHTQIAHEVSSLPTYEVQSIALTEDLQGVDAYKWISYKRAVNVFDRAAVYRAASSNSIFTNQQILEEMHANWSTQRVEASVIERHPYTSSLRVDSIDVEIEDATVPGIQFSTNSLVVSESGRGNDYQILLLSEPTNEVFVVLDTQSDCYRECYMDPVCPSSQNFDADFSCGGGSAGTKLCNVSVSPEVLLFTPKNWSFPQTVRVVAVDDRLDEADVHLSIIKARSESLDPVYNALYLPDIVVAVEDNDDSAIAYSTLEVTMAEINSKGTNYSLALLTEPWANVTIAMSNEIDGSCYRRCGYPFDDKDCGLPRQQSVSSVRLASKSPREIHEISLRLPRPRVMEVQRIVTYADHVDHIYSVQVTGGFAPEVQMIEFAFNSAFKTRFKSATAIAAAGTYLRTFKVGIRGKTVATSSIDGFAMAAQVETAINGLLLGRATKDNVVRVSRELLYDQAVLRWRVTFLRFVAEDLAFPTLTATVDTPFEGSLIVKRVQTMAPPTGSLRIQYGKNEGTSTASFALVADISDIEAQLRDIDTVFTALVSRSTASTSSPSPVYGVIFSVTFTTVESYETLVASTRDLTAAANALTPDVLALVVEARPPVQIGGFFIVKYASPYVNTSVNATVGPLQTGPIAWNTSSEIMKASLANLHGLGAVEVSRQQLSPEGAMAWTVAFVNNNGNLPMLEPLSLNLTGKGVTVQAVSIVEGVSLGGFFTVEMGGPMIKTNPTTQRVYNIVIGKRNATNIPFNIAPDALAQKLVSLQVTELMRVTRDGIDCDVFDVCEGYIWTINYINSPGNLPPIQVYSSNEAITDNGAVLSARTVANGTYLSGFFSLKLELFDAETNVTHRANTWNLPVNVSAPGMDQALEAIYFVRSNREAEYDPETRLSRGMLFDKGVRVYREGPYLDGGYTWRLDWAIEDYKRFQDLRITINTSLVTQLMEPLSVPSELDLTGTPRCSAIPMARFELDDTDPFKLRGFCVYDLENVTTQERYLCNYTVVNPWIVFTSKDWCTQKRVQLSPVNDFIDEATIENANITFSNVTHTVFSDDLIYSALPLERVLIAVESDDVARVVVSESHLDVSEDGSVVAYYELVLTTEPLYDVNIVVLPWLDSTDTKCYRFGLCNVTLDVNTYVFTPRNWNIPQRVVVKATDDDLDEYDNHETGISHVSYSDDLKYHQLPAIPKIHVTVADNDDSGFFVNKASVNVTEGGETGTYEVVLGSEPFAKVTVSIQNVGTKGNYATSTPTKLVFTWLNWSVPQTVTVSAVDDATQDPVDSSSVMAHSLSTNDLIYAKLKNLGSVRVWIRDNDVSGIELSVLTMSVEERALPFKYAARLTSEPWYPVTIIPNGMNDCYVRAATQERVCNVSMITTAVYFGASNWSQWQSVDFLAFDDSLDEAPIHKAMITHASISKDPMYVSVDYVDKRLMLAITDNDISFVSISLAVASNTSRSRLHVAEGGFNDSYYVVLKTEPYEDVVVTVFPRVERIVSIDSAIPPFDSAQVGAAYGSKSSIPAGSMILIFTALDWFLPRSVTVFGIDDGIPEDPTQFSSIGHSVYSADSKYNISNASLGIVDVPVIISDREAVPPPLPQSSIFDVTGTRILVTFDSTVYHAATMVIKAAPTGSAYAPRLASFACSMVFSSLLAPLGSGATCTWRSDLRQLIVTLGIGATILPNDVLLLYECSSFVKQVCQSPNVLRARHTSHSYTQATITLRVDPTAVTKPKIVLSIPEQVGTCGTWRADASLSTGSAGRPFKELRWMALPRSAISSLSVSADVWSETSKTLFVAMSPLCQKYGTATAFVKADLSNQLSSFITSLDQLRTACYLRALSVAASTSSALRVDVNSSLLLSDSTYVFGLSLTNAFEQQTIVVQSVYVGKQPSPVVFAVGDSSLQVSRGESTQPITLQADATLSCPLLTGAQVAFKWFVTAADSDGGGSPVALNLNSTNLAKDPRVFRVPRSQLVAGRTYRFRVDASVPQAASGSAYFTVRVSSSPLTAVILGGNRTVGEKDSLVLNGSLSNDPDLAPEPLLYTWRCEDWTNETMAALGLIPCLNSSTASLSPLVLPSASLLPLLTVDPFTFAPQRSLRFYLTVSKITPMKTMRTAFTQTRVWTTVGSVPEVLIQASASKLNPSSRLTLNSVVKSTYPYSVRWVEDEGDLGLPPESSNITTHNAFAMNLTSPNNAVRRNVLTPGQHYTLRLIATDINGNRGFGLVSFTVNAPPSPGRFQISPREGFAMIDTFSLECMQWTDDAEDLPLKYSFGVLPTSIFDTLGMNVTLVRQRMLPLTGEQLLPAGRVTMLPPDVQDSADMTVVAFIVDSMGGIAMASDSITVRMPASATSQPVAFVSTLLSAQNASDGATKSKYLFSAALVLQRALSGASSLTDCPGTGSTSGICSGRGTCDSATVVCVCDAGYMGQSCEFTVADIRQINGAIFSSLASSSVQAAEPSSSGLSQQALVVDTVTQSSSAAFDEDGLGQVTSLSSEIAQNAFALQDSAGFLDSTGATLLSSLSVVLSVVSTASASDSQSIAASASTTKRNRRLAEEDNSSGSFSASSCKVETPTAKKTFRRLIATLQSVAGIASQDLLPGESPVQLSSGQITTTVGAGRSLKSPSSALSVSLTNVAIACLGTNTDSDLLINTFQLKTPPHPTCSLKEAITISAATVMTIIDKASLSAALVGKANGELAPLRLTSDSLCVAQAASRNAAAGKATRRLDVEAVWQPLVALSIPHARALTAVEQRNFTTGCRAWNSSSEKWESDVCFKDDTTSSLTVTVCYCGEIRAAPGLEVLVTLEERLDFFALSRDLYRNDDPSVVGSVALAILVGIFVCGSKYGQMKDLMDDKREKDKTIASLNRSKWSELQERTQAGPDGGFEDFATFMAKREKQNEANAVTAATSDSHLTTIASRQDAQNVLNCHVSIPDETRVLFSSCSTLRVKYETLLWILRGCNVVLATIGVVSAFVGVDFYLVLGNSTSSSLVLFLYGKPIGIVLLCFGGLLITMGLWGVFVAREANSSPRIVSSFYTTLLWVCLLGELFFVCLAFRYVNDLESLPFAGVEPLRSVWSRLSPQLQDEIQTSYGCCGFSSILEAVDGCPEEALDASPPLTCVRAIEAHALELFSTSVVYLQGTFLVQIAALLTIRSLQTWRRLRLQELIEDSDSNALPFRSILDVMVYCSVPTLLQSLLSLMALVFFIGVDSLAQLHVLSNALTAGLLGIEIGVIHIVIAVVYAAMLLQGLLAFRRRDVRRLQSFTAMSIGGFLVSVALFIFVDQFHNHWLLDPAIVDFIHTKFVQLPRQTLVEVETSLECCGFSEHSEGACVTSPTDNQPIATCRNLVLGALNRELETLRHRALVFSVIHVFVLVIAATTSLRLRRFAVKPHIRPDAPPENPSVILVSFTHAFVHQSSLLVLLVISTTAFVFGLVVIGAGVDATYQLNVLHLSALLRVFDRHAAAYLLSAGMAITLFGALGVSVALSISHRFHRHLLWLFAGVSVGIFVAAFGLSGFAYRFAHVPLSDEALEERLESFWIAVPPATTRVFLQNALSCCGYEKIERLNGSVVYTDPGELSAWHLASETVTTGSYSTIAPTPGLRRQLSVNLLTPRRLTQIVCPELATEACAPKLKGYVRRVASRAFQLAVALLVCDCSVLVAVAGLLWKPSLENRKESWRVSTARITFFALALALLFVALASLFLGLDIVTHWSLFSSTALQLVFPRSIGVAFFVYATLSSAINVYAIQGIARGVVHRVFLQSTARLFLIHCGWLCVGLTGYVSRFGGSQWLTHLRSFLDGQWDTLTPLTQHRISLEFQCCGFNDPVLVKGRGIVYDRPAVGYSCSLAAARGCRHVLETQIGGSFGWIFTFVLTVTLADTLALACGVAVLRHLQKAKPHDWFVIESRLRFAAGKYRSELRRTHLLLSLVSHFDRKLTRAQRLASVLGGLVTTFAVYAAWFAHEGCHRHALKSCQQPGAWGFLGMGIVYGGLVGFAAQLVVRGLFEAVRNRSDDETIEVAVTRQRKEKALLFRGMLSSRNRKPLIDPRVSDKASVAVLSASSLLESPSHATTEERWYSWLSSFLHSLFCVSGTVLFLFGCGLATFMGLVLLGLNDSLYGVKFDQGPKEALVLGLLIAATALLAWLAIDVKQRRPNGGRSAAVFVAVALASALLLGGLCLGLFMASQTLDEDPSNWTIRNTNFSVPQRLQSAWAGDVTGFFRRRVQQELQCCGFRDGTDAPFRPCPQGTTVNVQYEAVRVDGRVVVESKDEVRDLVGCYPKMLTQFHIVLDQVAYVVIATGVALLLLALSAIFLAHDVSTAKDAKLKLRVATTSASSSDVRETFEKVVGLKIAAPARGKILSKMLSASLENVAPHVVTELSSASLTSHHHPPSAEAASSSTFKLPNGQVVSSSLARNRWDVAAAVAAENVPYPAWIVRVVFALWSVWMAAMCYVVVVNSLELGVTTAWRLVAAWAVGVIFHLAVVEPLVVFFRIVLSTLGQWWRTTAVARLLRYGRDALRIRPSAEAEAARYYASLSLYERIRFNAAVRIQRHLATRLARRRFLQTVRERREQTHRLLVAHRRLVLKKSIEGFSAEEIEAFRLLFQDADTARLGLVSYTVISQSIYQLGVHVDAALVREFLVELDPAYADLVDFEHFLYGMHRVRVHHQEEQAAIEAAKAMTADERDAAALAKEEFVSSSSRFGPAADPQSRVLVKRQNLLRELREKRESLSYRLMSKVSKLPPLLQRGRSAQGVTSGIETESQRQATASDLVEAAAVEDANPTGSYVLLQNRKLSPKKRALEMMLKKKSREEKEKVRSPPGDSTAHSPRKMVPSLRLPGSPRARTRPKEDDTSTADVPRIPTIVESDETEPPSPQKTGGKTASNDNTEAAGSLAAHDEESKPFGTFMLLAKQTANAGKHKVMAKVLHQRGQSAPSADAAGSDDEDAAASRPPTAERATSAAKSSLEKALKRKTVRR